MMIADSHAKSYYCPPRLGISHLLLWTAVVAVHLKLSSAVEMLFGEAFAQNLQAAGLQFSQAQFILIRANWFLDSVTDAAAIVGILILLRAKIGGCWGRLQPGHWLVLTGGVAALMMFLRSLLYLGFWLATEKDGLPWHSGYSWTFVAQTILLAGIYAWATWASRGSKWWQSSFALLAIANLFRCLPQIPGVMWWLLTRIDLQPAVLRMGRDIFSVTAMVILVVAVVIDLIDRERRDWLHWTGIAVIVSTSAVMPAIRWTVQQLF